MKRRHIWMLTTACCALLALPTVARLIGLIIPVDAVSTHAAAMWHALHDAATAGARLAPSFVARSAHALVTAAQRMMPPWPLVDRVGPWQVGAPVVIGALTLAVVLIALALLLVARRRAPVATRVRRLARRGRAVSTIARHTGLSQDAVRHVLCPEPPAGQGRFANALTASLDGSYGPATAYGRDR